jgi:hypothetical protein
MVAEETNEFAASSQRKYGTSDSNWEDTNADKIETVTDLLTYMEIGHLQTLEYFVWGYLCMHHCKTGHDTKIVKKGLGSTYTSTMKNTGLN